MEHRLFSHILGIIIPVDFHIFRRGSNHQPVLLTILLLVSQYQILCHYDTIYIYIYICTPCIIYPWEISPSDSSDFLRKCGAQHPDGGRDDPGQSDTGRGVDQGGTRGD